MRKGVPRNTSTNTLNAQRSGGTGSRLRTAIANPRRRPSAAPRAPASKSVRPKPLMSEGAYRQTRSRFIARFRPRGAAPRARLGPARQRLIAK